MFELEAKEGFEEEFAERYDIFKDLLSDGEFEVEKYSYEEALDILNFFKLCKKNYIVMFLESELITYIHQLEDDSFLSFYLARQDGDEEKWLSEAASEEVKRLKNCLQNDVNLAEVVPEVYNDLVKDGRNYHI